MQFGRILQMSQRFWRPSRASERTLRGEENCSANPLGGIAEQVLSAHRNSARHCYVFARKHLVLNH